MPEGLIRSRRRSLSVEIKDCQVIVRVPLRTGEKTIEAFLHQNRAWIEL